MIWRVGYCGPARSTTVRPDRGPYFVGGSAAELGDRAAQQAFTPESDEEKGKDEDGQLTQVRWSLNRQDVCMPGTAVAPAGYR